METKDKIAQILKKTFSVDRLEIIDESHLHASHPEAKKSGGGHFSILIVSRDFQGKTLVQRHRMVHEALKHELKSDIHALSIQASTPK